MTNHCGYVTVLKNVRLHPNADRLLLGECFGNTVCVSTEYKEGMIGVYFQTGLQLSEEFCVQNHLLRKLPDGSPDTGYMDCNKRNVTTIKLRGEVSDGLFLPISCLDYCYDGSELAQEYLSIGDTITVVNGKEICKKYVPAVPARKGRSTDGNKTRKVKAPIAPLFMEHADTEQLAYNLAAFSPGDDIEITLKMHGTSQRTAYLPVLQKYKKTIWDRICGREGTPVYDWGYVTGTRRTVLDTYEGGFYGSNKFREQHHERFKGKLLKGESVYYEVVGFTETGAPIMGNGDNKNLGKDFIKEYGETTVFSYGCHPQGWNMHDPGYNLGRSEPQSDIYVYRMTMTNEDGDVVEYTPDFMRYRCEQMGVKTVPVFWSGRIPENTGSAEDSTITAGEWIKNKAELYYDGADPIGKTHIKEGVVVRINNKPKFCAYKHKNNNFKIISGIAVDNIKNTEDISQDILEEM